MCFFITQCMFTRPSAKYFSYPYFILAAEKGQWLITLMDWYLYKEYKQEKGWAEISSGCYEEETFWWKGLKENCI